MPATSPASPASATVIPPHHDPARPVGAALGPWITRASCAREDTGIFFPPADSPATEARRICARVVIVVAGRLLGSMLRRDLREHVRPPGDVGLSRRVRR